MSNAAKQPKITPAMRQFHDFKEKYPDCVLFFRMGDFYEMFHDDAVLAHKVLGVTLTQRTEGVPMAGVPFHAVESYMNRMIKAGYRVAVCDQVEDPAKAKGVVKRDVTRIITPGTLTDENLLEEGQENPLAAVQLHKDHRASVAWVELSTGNFHIATFANKDLVDELARIAPSELLYEQQRNVDEAPELLMNLKQTLGCILTPRPAWQFRASDAMQMLQKQYEVKTLEGFGIADNAPEIGVAGGVLAYLLETQRTDATRLEESTATPGKIRHLLPPKKFERNRYLVIDQVSLRSLEVERTIRSESSSHSLVATLQSCVTAMGKRQLRHWLCYPLCDKAAIEQRQDLVQALIDDSRFLEQLREALDNIQDIQRITGRIAVGRATPRDLVALGHSSTQVQALAALLDQRPSVATYHQQIADIHDALAQLGGLITQTCVDEPPAHMRDGGLIRDGMDETLDECRSLRADSKAWLARYQKQLVEETGIPSLKVGYNKVFGFYIEVTAAHKDKAPDSWSRKQTLKNVERYITQPLKEYEGKVLTAQDRANARELELFNHLCAQAQLELTHLHAFAQTVADLDVLACFARRAVRHRYVRPVISEKPVLNIVNGRHPVLDQVLGEQFVPNDVQMGKDATLALITGPNMAGKSTYIRQAALLTLLAHTGCFVPAQEAEIGLCDRIFTRIGASDELHTGQSTFMVEMTETANICHHATPGSLVILDEIGRGTSTLDGLSLAWAIAEHLAERNCRTLFATHYHEITHLAERFSNVTNLRVTVREWQDQIVFLHRIVAGATDRSFGTHVAKIAGIPSEVIDRANALLGELAVNHAGPSMEKVSAKKSKRDDPQMSLFTEYIEHPAMETLRKADVMNMTPMQAMDLLHQLQADLEN
ncbi:MAG: DNA mismatch repair protein MutS [Phycisphaeraceae bacterium]|nr:DNA mismatch repair protein MutS [Phycisphaeraceae bacterium]